MHKGTPRRKKLDSDKDEMCLLNRPPVERVENEAGHGLQILRVNYKDKIGVDIANRYGVNFTPTLRLFNGRGEKECSTARAGYTGSTGNPPPRSA